jgi:hypothetical protein
MTDIFREVDEDVRRAKVEAIWKRYGNLISGAALVIVLAAAGWQVYGRVLLKQEERASAKFQTAIEAAEAGDITRTQSLLESVIKKGPDGYRLLAHFRAAAETGKSDPQAAAAIYDELAGEAKLGPTLQGMARLRAATLLADSLSAADLAKRLEPLLGTANPWRSLARELVGLANLKAGDFDAAGRSFDDIVTDPEAPLDLRQRVEIYLGLVRAGPLPPKS